MVLHTRDGRVIAVTNKILIIAYFPLYLRSFLDKQKMLHEMRSGWKQNTSCYQPKDTRNSQFVEVARWFSVARQNTSFSSVTLPYRVTGEYGMGV